MPVFNPHIFEMVMMICFGCSWPFAIAKTIRSKTVAGKSLFFITLVLVGYLCGITSKLIGNFDHVIWLYAINASLVATELLLYFRYNRSAVHQNLRRLGQKWQHLYGLRKQFEFIQPGTARRRLPKGETFDPSSIHPSTDP